MFHIVHLLFTSLLISLASGATLQLVSSSRGSIDAGNYSYFYLNDQGTFKLVLASTHGDCDLYVRSSDGSRLVTFDNYEYQSITYGQDVIWLTADMKRPVVIGVYAHPYYIHSSFVLSQYKVLMDTSEHNVLGEFSYTDFLNRDLSGSDINKFTESSAAENVHSHTDMYQFEQNQYQQQQQQQTKQPNDEEEAADDTENGGRSLIWSLFIHLIEFIAEVFL